LSLCLVLFLAGCGTVTHERSSFDGLKISNPTFGEGLSYYLPFGYERLVPTENPTSQDKNAAFELFLRRVAHQDDQKPGDGQTFRECLLFRSGQRYLMMHHVGLSMPETFRTMHPALRETLFPELAANVCRTYGITGKDFAYKFETISGRKTIVHEPFAIKTKNGDDEGWRGAGYSLIGDLNEVVLIFGFARVADLPAAQDDLRLVMEDLALGAPARRP
jgi:hypothetical protein